MGPAAAGTLEPQAPVPRHVHGGDFGPGRCPRAGRQDQIRQSPHDPGVRGGDPWWGDAGTAGLRRGSGKGAMTGPEQVPGAQRLGRGLDVVNQPVWGSSRIVLLEGLLLFEVWPLRE